MGYIQHHRWAQIVAAAVIVLAVVAGWQFITLQKAHSSFANYAAFRGCTQITSQSDASGTCTLASGQTITMVKFNGGWYLDGDLPVCRGNFCI